MGDNRPTTYTDPSTGKVIYRASGTGNCIRGLVASRLGYAPTSHPDWLLKKFDEGNAAEPVILKRIADETGWKLLDPHDMTSYKDLSPMVCREAHDDQFTLEIPVGSDVLIRCHLDGIGYCYSDVAGDDGHVGETRVVEVKAFGESYWEKFAKEGILAFPYYSAQVAIQMYGTGLGAVFIVAQKDKSGELTGEWKWEWYDEPPVSMGSIKAKVAKVERLVKEDQLPPCDWNQYPCQFYTLHEVDEPSEGKPDGVDVDGVMGDMLDTAAEAYARGGELEKEGKALKKTNGDIIKKWFDDEGKKGGKVTTTRFVVEDVVVPKQEYVVKAYEQRYPKVKPVESKEEGGKGGNGDEA